MASMMGMSVGFLGRASAQTLAWKNFSCMYNVNSISLAGGKVWAATSGGVFSYSPGARTFNQFTTTEGLSNIQATSIISDSGNIFVGEGDGTIDELNSFGAPLRSQKDIEKSSALSKQVTNLVLAGDTLFACTPFGVVLISESSFGVIDSYLHFVPGQTITQANLSVAIFAGNIYVGSPFGLSGAPRSAANLSAPDSWKVSDTLGLSSGVNALAVFNGSLVVGTKQGLFYSTDGATFQNLSGPDSVLTLTSAGNSLLVNSRNGLFRLHTDNSITVVYSSASAFHCVVSSSDTTIVAGTSQGLLAIGASGQSQQQILPPGPATNIINHLSVDNAGNLWCGTSGSNVGVAYMKFEFDSTKWENFSMAQNPVLPTNTFYQVSAVCNNQVVAGSWGKGMALLNEDGSVKRIFDNSNSPLVGIPKHVDYVLVGNAVCDPNGNIWMTNFEAYNGNILAVYSPQDSSWYTFQNSYSAPAGFISIAIDGFGGVWAGDQYADDNLNYHGVFYYNDNGTLANTSDDNDLLITTSSGLLSNQVNSVLVDNEDQVWIGTTLGLNVIYDPTDPSFVSSIYSMLDQDILGVDYDALDDKWVSTVDGVYELSKDGNTRVAEYDMTNSPLPGSYVVSVACDRIHGIVYFATNYGVTQLRMGVVQPQTNFSQIKVYPNPVRYPLKQGYVEIAGLVPDSQIKIFSVSGKLVCNLQEQQNNAGRIQGNIAYWGGTDDNGKLLPTGIYIIIAYSSDGSQTAVAKVAVVR